MSNLRELAELSPKPIWDGVTARIVESERITLSVVELEPNRLVPEHRHANEQVGMVIQGSITFAVGDEKREFGPGGTWRILSDVPHEAVAGPDGAVVIEVFSPIRDDWHSIDDDEPRAPAWPGNG